MYPVAALAVENEGASAAAGPASVLDTVVGGMMLAIVVDSFVGVIELVVAAVGGGVIAENDGESVGKVNPCVGVAEFNAAAVLSIGGGANELVVDGVVTGAVGEAIPALPGSAYDDVGEAATESDLGVIALAPNA